MLSNPRQGRDASLTRGSPSHLLKLIERLLAEAALVSSCPALQQLMQRLREAPDLQGGHESAHHDLIDGAQIACVTQAKVALLSAFNSLVNLWRGQADPGGAGGSWDYARP